MKNKITSIFLFLALFQLVACEDFLDEDPKGMVVGDNALSSVDGLESALVGVYAPLKSSFNTGFAAAQTPAVLMGSDDLTTHPASNKQDMRQMDQFNVTSLNGRSQIIWAGLYQSIQAANNILNNYESVDGDEAQVNAIVGEAYFLRAFDYYWLVRLYGNIPLMTVATYSEDQLTVSPSTPAEVYQLIESDLQKADQLLSDQKRDPGRPSRGSAKALLADVYLAEAGWPIMDQSKYAMAAAKAKEVMDNSASYGFDLNTPLSTLWSGVYSDDRSSEEVFYLTFNAADNINALNGISAMPGDIGGWDDYFSEINFFLNFPEGIRKDITFDTEIDGNGWENSDTRHPYYKKFYAKDDAGNYSLTYRTSLPIIFIRFAHVLLIYAEAEARSGNMNSDAYNALNAVRERAGLEPLSGLSGNDFIEAVIRERSWEFAGEYTRWFDLVRLQRVAAANSNRDPREIPLIGTPDDNTHAGYYLPIPGDDASQNPNL